MKKVTDKSLLAQLEGASKQSLPDDTAAASQTLSSQLKQSLMDIGTQMLGGTGESLAKNLLPQGLARGYGQQTGRSLEKAGKGLTQLISDEDIPKVKEYVPQNIQELIGQIGGGIGANVGAAAPLIAAGEALAPAALGEFLPSLLSASGAGAALSPKGERMQGAMEYAAPMAAFKATEPLIGSLLKALKAHRRKVMPENTYDKLVQAYDNKKNVLGDIFQFVSNEAKQRGIEKVGEIPPEVFEMAEEYGLKTPSYKLLLKNAKTGDYDAVRRLYSRAGEFERKAEKSQDWEKAHVFNEIKQLINDGLSEHFKQTGHPDLGQWLDYTRQGYRRLQNLYKSPFEPKIRKLVGENREYPETLKPLTRNARSTKALLDAHPEVAHDIEAYNTLKQFEEKLKKAKARGKTALSALLINQLLKHKKIPEILE